MLPLLLALYLPAFAQSPGLPSLESSFRQPPPDSRIMMRWWWFGPAITKPEIERELRIMKEGGIGGVEIQPVYPVALDDANQRTLPYLSNQFIDALRFAAAKARELGLRVDITLGSGWPYGGPHVRIDHASARLRVDNTATRPGSRRVPLPSIGNGEKLITAFAGQNQITEFRDGAAWVPQGYSGEVQFFVSSRTGQQVKRPAVGAEGFVLDHLQTAAIDAHLKTVADRLMEAFGPNPPHAIFCDSLEVYGADWTEDYLDEFRKRRGYDLTPHLPTLVSNQGDRTAALRYDWGRTLTELLEDRFYKPMHGWARRNKTLFRIQGYGTPPAAISSFAYADLPEGEGPQWKVLRASRWAASASHLLGRNTTSSETWTWLHSPSFRATPLDIKAEADLHFLQGINQLIGHGWAYSPPEAGYPGWRFYAAGVFSDKNPWWPVMPEVASYLQRLSFLMRAGQPANDVAFYLSNSDGWAHFTPGRADLIHSLGERLGANIVARVLESGFNLDFFDDGTLDQMIRSGRYRIVVLPNVERIPLQTLRALEDYARKGGNVIAVFRKPHITGGFLTKEEENQEIRAIAKRLFDGPSAPGRFAVNENAPFTEALSARLKPDVALTPAAPAIGFIHRSTPDAEIYFLANSSNQPLNVKATFRVEGRNAELWDPFTGLVESAPTPGNTLALSFVPHGSRVVVFTKRQLPRKPAPSPTRETIDISADWSLTFPHAAPRKLTSLQSWTDFEETRYFSGTATYSKEVAFTDAVIKGGVTIDFGEAKPVPEGRQPAGMRAWLDPPIHEAAIISINGQRAGSLWCPPYSLDITAHLKPGANTIQIAVSNTAINSMAGRRLPDYRLLNLRYGSRFDPQDMDKVHPYESGILGPVRLLLR